MKKIALLGGVFLLLAGAGCVKIADDDINQEENQVVEEELIVDSLTYLDGGTGLVLDFPENWSGKYTVKSIVSEDVSSVVLTYKAVEEGRESMLSVYNIYRRDKDVSELFHEPNTKIVLQNMDYIVVLSQPLDMPYMQDTTDFDIYSDMVDDIYDVAKGARFNTGIYASVTSILEYKTDEGFVIEAMYPELGGASTNFTSINEQISEQIEIMVGAFRDNLLEWDDKDAPEEAHSSLYINFVPKMLTENKVSIYYTVSEYFAGSAHPMNYSMGYNYDLKSNKEIVLGDLFNKSEDDYLESLSNLIIEKLEVELDKRDVPIGSMFDSGTEPKVENFSNFNISEDGVVFIFSPYAIAPYAAGSFEVLVSYDEFKSL